MMMMYLLEMPMEMVFVHPLFLVGVCVILSLQTLMFSIACQVVWRRSCQGLYIGAYDPSAYDEGTNAEQSTANGVASYLKISSSFNMNEVFEVTDEHGRL